MSARAPKITPAQRQLEAMQQRQLAENARLDNVRSDDAVRLQRRMLFGTLGHNLFAEAGAARHSAQLAGSRVVPSLIDPATVAAQREERLAAAAGGFNTESARRMRTLIGAFRPRA